MVAEIPRASAIPSDPNSAPSLKLSPEVIGKQVSGFIKKFKEIPRYKIYFIGDGDTSKTFTCINSAVPATLIAECNPTETGGEELSIISIYSKEEKESGEKVGTRSQIVLCTDPTDLKGSHITVKTCGMKEDIKEATFDTDTQKAVDQVQELLKLFPIDEYLEFTSDFVRTTTKEILGKLRTLFDLAGRDVKQNSLRMITSNKDFLVASVSKVWSPNKITLEICDYLSPIQKRIYPNSGLKIELTDNEKCPFILVRDIATGEENRNNGKALQEVQEVIKKAERIKS